MCKNTIHSIKIVLKQCEMWPVVQVSVSTVVSSTFPAIKSESSA